MEVRGGEISYPEISFDLYKESLVIDISIQNICVFLYQWFGISEAFQTVVFIGGSFYNTIMI